MSFNVCDMLNELSISELEQVISFSEILIEEKANEENQGIATVSENQGIATAVK